MNRPHATAMQQRKMRGFTLIELMVTVAILIILTTAALPAFRAFIVAQRIKSASFDIMSTLILARSEAIKRNSNVVITPTGGSWLNGWIITAGATTLNSRSVLGSAMSVTCYTGGAAVACSAVTYTSNGRLSGTTPSIQLNSVGPTSTSGDTRCISIDLSGRPNSKKGTC